MDRAIVDYLANAVWQLPILMIGVSLALWASGAGAKARHRVWLSVLLVALLLPLFGMKDDAVLLPSIAVATDQEDFLPAEIAPAIAEQTEPALPVVAVSAAMTSWIVRLYAASLVFFAWRILRAWIATQGLLRRSRSTSLAPRAMAIFAQAADSQNVPLPRLRQSGETASPLMIGAFRPVLLLPEGFHLLKEDEIMAALCHELAHQARRDYLVNLLCQCAALPLAWHPATRLLLRRIRDTREMICDSVAAEEMNSPLRYATCLVGFALRALDGPPAAAATQAVGMFDDKILEERIMRLTQKQSSVDPRTRLMRLAGGAAGLSAAVAMILMVHVTPTFAEPPAANEIPAPAELPTLAEIPVPAQAVNPPVPLVPPAAPKAPKIPKAPKAPDAAEMQRTIDEEARERAMEQREAAREAAVEAREKAREKAREAREQSKDEMKRQMAQTMRAAEAARGIDLAAIDREVEQATSFAKGPEFREQMAELRENMKELHQSMAELDRHMKELHKQMDRAKTDAPM